MALSKAQREANKQRAAELLESPVMAKLVPAIRQRRKAALDDGDAATLPERTYAEEYLKHGDKKTAFKAALPEASDMSPQKLGYAVRDFHERNAVQSYIRHVVNEAGATAEKAGRVLTEAMDATKYVKTSAEDYDEVPDHATRLGAVDRVARIQGWNTEESNIQTGALIIPSKYALLDVTPKGEE